jgi:diguanylate cyclase (GGDEF)-like protein
MPERRAHDGNGHHSGNVIPEIASRESSRRRGGDDIWKQPPDRDLEGWFSSALMVSDKELGNFLHEVDEISKSLDSDAPSAESLRVAQHPAVWNAIKHVILERELRHLALTDDLTCLYNRRGFFAAATQQLKLARRNQCELLLVFCDVDGLKAINDTYGHAEGDLALVRTANALESSFRDSDILARIGGDEFVVLALNATGQDQKSILQRCIDHLRQTSQEDARYKLSLSIGTARFDPRSSATLGELIAVADAAMYAQKRIQRKMSGEDAVVSGEKLKS